MVRTGDERPHDGPASDDPVGEGSGVERRRTDRRRLQQPVPLDRRRGERRQATVLTPPAATRGQVIVDDAWPLIANGLRVLVQDLGYGVIPLPSERSRRARREAGEDDPALAIIGHGSTPIADRVAGVADAHPGCPVIVLLDHFDADAVRDVVGLGAMAVLTRSTGEEDLREAIERVLAGHRVLSGPVLRVLAGAGLQVAPQPHDHAGLTPKELEVLGVLVEAPSNAGIAEELHLSLATVKSHLSNIYAKLGVASRHEAIDVAVQRGILA